MYTVVFEVPAPPIKVPPFASKEEAQVFKAEHHLGKFAAVMPYMDAEAIAEDLAYQRYKDAKMERDIEMEDKCFG